MDSPARQIIMRLGGITEVASELGVPLTTVSSWGRKNRIPEWRQPALMRLALEKNIPLSTSDFPAKPLRLTA
jgi:hypothetical protein